MYGSWVLLVLILVSSLPVVFVYIWFRAAKYQYSVTRFLLALLAGAAAFFPALILQEYLTFFSFTQGRAALFFEFFIRVALSEEISRLLVLFIFFWINGLVNRNNVITSEQSEDQSLAINNVKRATATGLVAGLGFSILESARYAASGMEIGTVLLRIFTAALHGACGSRIGAAAVMFRTNPVQAFLRIFTATAIHGVYNFMIIRSGFPLFIAILISLSALATAILAIKGLDQKYSS